MILEGEWLWRRLPSSVGVVVIRPFQGRIEVKELGGQE